MSCLGSRSATDSAWAVALLLTWLCALAWSVSAVMKAIAPYQFIDTLLAHTGLSTRQAHWVAGAGTVGEFVPLSLLIAFGACRCLGLTLVVISTVPIGSLLLGIDSSSCGCFGGVELLEGPVLKLCVGVGSASAGLAILLHQ